MKKINKACIVGDAMIPGKEFESAFKRYLSAKVENYAIGDWESDWGQLQYRRLEVEKQGPEIETVPELIKTEGAEAEIAMGLFVPVSSKMMDAMPKLKIVGVCRAGLENVNVEEANKRGVLVFNVKGRNAEAVSDFAVGLMLAEARNIARAHYAIKKGEWRKTFSNSDAVPQLKEKKIGIVGFGFIGQLVAQKLSGFKPEILVYDPYYRKNGEEAANIHFVSKEELFSESDFVTVHARLTEENKGMVGMDLLSLMKPTSYLINTGRAGLIDQKALVEVLKKGSIAGAGLDVFPTEPIPEGDELINLDNVTLTTHIAGTTKEALSNSPGLLMEDIEKFLKGDRTNFIVNPEVLKNNTFKQWFDQVRE